MIESLIPHPWHLPIWFVVVTLACLLFCGAIRWQSAIRFATAVIVLAVGFALGAVSSFAWPAEPLRRVDVLPVVAVVEKHTLLDCEAPDAPKDRTAVWADVVSSAVQAWDLREPESPHPPLPAP